MPGVAKEFSQATMSFVDPKLPVRGMLSSRELLLQGAVTAGIEKSDYLHDYLGRGARL